MACKPKFWLNPLLLIAYTYNSIDLTNTSAFTNTEIYHTNSYVDPVVVPAGMYDGKWQLNWYYNVSDSKYYYVVGTDIFTVDAGWIVDTTDNAYINGIYRQRYNLGVDMGVEADNVSLEWGTGINVKWTSLWGTLTDLYKKCINIYELT